jgi:anti-anti-sigma factor
MALTIVPPSAETIPARSNSPLSGGPEHAASSVVVVLGGELDLFARPLLSDVLSRVIDTDTGDVTIDLADTTFVDTATVRTFAAAHLSLTRRGRRLSFRSPSRLATKVISNFGLADLIETGQQVRAGRQ